MGLRDVLSKIKAHHASPHDFDVFRWDDEVRGKGTGDQAYGEGVYLAESPKEMESYYDFFKDRNPPEEALWDVIYDIQRNNSRGRAPADITRIQEQLRASHDPVIRALADNPDALPSLQTVINDTGIAGSTDPLAVSSALQRLKGHMPKPTAHRYDVEVDARKSDLLGWHDRLNEQSDDVRGTMSDLLKPDLERMQTVREQMLQKGGQGVPGSRSFRPLTDLQRVQYSNPPNPTGEVMYNLLRRRENAVEPTQTSGQYASDTLRDAGIPGSFHDDSTTTASNLVIFKPEIINIIKKYGIPGALGAGLISQADADAYAAEMQKNPGNATPNPQGTHLFGKESLWDTPSHRAGPSQRDLKNLTYEESYDPNAPAAPSQNVDVKGFGSLTGRDDTLRDTLTGAIAKPLSMVAPSGRSGYQAAQKLMSLAEFNPVVGAATSAGDFVDATKRGDKSEMATSALFTGLNALGVGGMVKGFKGAAASKPLMPWGNGLPVSSFDETKRLSMQDLRDLIKKKAKKAAVPVGFGAAVTVPPFLEGDD